MDYNLKDSHGHTVVYHLDPKQVEQMLNPKSDPDKVDKVVAYIKQKTEHTNFKIKNNNWG